VKFYKKDFLLNVEKGTNASFSNIISNRWISIRLDLTVTFVIICTGAYALGFKNRIDSGLLSLTLLIITDVVGFFAYTIRVYIEL
jgi:hypothetical protein